MMFWLPLAYMTFLCMYLYGNKAAHTLRARAERVRDSQACLLFRIVCYAMSRSSPALARSA